MIFFFIITFITFCILILYCLLKNNAEETWSNTYSGWPGPIESALAVNIPELRGSDNPKYNAPYHYRKASNKYSRYKSFMDLPH